MVDYLGNPDYASKRSLLKTGNYFNKEFIYHRIPEELIPYDYEVAYQNPCQLFVTVTNVQTGKAEYLLCEDVHRDIDMICASSSLPMLSEIQWINENGYLDGGLADPIPFQEAKKNAKKCVVVLTKTKGYTCTKQSSVLFNAMKVKYHSYPKLLNTIEHRHLVYNRSMRQIEQDKNTFVIRPSKELSVDRLEKNVDKLKALYDLGYADCLSQIENLKKFMN